MSTRRIQVGLRLEAEAIERIRQHPRYREAAPGREGGVPRWICELVHEALGLPPPLLVHEVQSAERKGRPRRSEAEE